jgi:hypothetical protein
MPPGIPNLQIENIGNGKKPLFVIKGFIELPCWNGYYLYDDTYKLKKDKVVTGGRIDLWVDGEIALDNNLLFSEDQINAYFFLVEHQESVKRSILQSLQQQFPRLLADEYASWDQEDPNLPQLADPTHEFDFKEYIGPESIHIGKDIKEGSAYVTWRFRCRWDIEHGLDIVTHKERVIEIAPEADPWKIYKDNGTYEQVRKEYKEPMSVAGPPEKKKWWQFWQ